MIIEILNKKIEKLVKFIEKELPNSCKDIDCKSCVLYNAKIGTTEDVVCDMLSARVRKSEERCR